MLSFGTVWGVLRHWWVVVKLGINLAVMVTDLVVVGPALRIALADGGPPHRLYDATIAHVLALTVAVVLSVVKPRARTAARPPPPGRVRCRVRRRRRRARQAQGVRRASTAACTVG